MYFTRDSTGSGKRDLKHPRRAQQGLFRKRGRLQLQADGEARARFVGESAVDGNAWNSSDIRIDGVDIAQLHRQRIGLAAERERGDWRGWTEHDIA